MLAVMRRLHQQVDHTSEEGCFVDRQGMLVGRKLDVGDGRQDSGGKNVMLVVLFDGG